MSIIAKRLAELGITLPEPAKAVAAYVPFVISGNLVFISGQLPIENGVVACTGRAGADVERCVKLGGFVASAPDFYEQPKVINGASELIEQVFGAAGKHARFAVGTSNLPRQATVEIDAIFSLR